jgi:hypothetical protein
MHKTFDAMELNEIKNSLAQKVGVRSQSPIGWSFLRKDFTFIFDILPSLKFKEGFTIRAFRYVSEFNGPIRLQFWAVPINEWLPQPEECMVYESKNISYPKPSCVLNNLMDAIDGDGSFESYISASMLFRELSSVKSFTLENWGLNIIIDDELMKKADSFDTDLYFQMLRDNNYRNSITKEDHFLFHMCTNFNTDEWKWQIDRNSILWKPTVEFDGNNVQVTFYTYYGHVKKTIFKYTDFFTKGSYRFESSCEIVAEGGQGYFI